MQPICWWCSLLLSYSNYIEKCTKSTYVSAVLKPLINQLKLILAVNVIRTSTTLHLCLPWSGSHTEYVLTNFMNIRDLELGIKVFSYPSQNFEMNMQLRWKFLLSVVSDMLHEASEIFSSIFKAKTSYAICIFHVWQLKIE